ncbi:MAG: AbrB/MazE/SpoVT family DNA-binding domain-containing protein, partial [Candidatus Tectomicrobia bacterium]|nr:AbrB/MazE/SpoVT family DNA-binding domain-containing protein [Candidatus Tectomicrobia bacterium]
KHQVTIPKDVFETLDLDVGDFLEATAEGGRIVLTPKQLAAKAPASRLTPAEQRILARAKAKIERIQQDMSHAKGLTEEEARVAAKAGLIDPDQKYWWTEAWQKGERAAEADRRAGRLRGPFATVEAFKEGLKKSGAHA